LHASVSGKLAYARLPDDLRELLIKDQQFERYTDKTMVDPERFRDELDLIRQRGYACSVDELEIGLTMIGVDVPARRQRGAVASVGIMGPTSRLVPSIANAVNAVQEAARHLSALNW
jgi:DNA-binding IclR family transcriptional regulator